MGGEVAGSGGGWWFEARGGVEGRFSVGGGGGGGGLGSFGVGFRVRVGVVSFWVALLPLR